MSHPHPGKGAAATSLAVSSPSSSGVLAMTPVPLTPTTTTDLIMRAAGIPCRVVERQRIEEWVDVPMAHGQLMEVRRYHSGRRAATATSRQLGFREDGEVSGSTAAINEEEEETEEGSLYGYVRFKDTNNRRSTWVPAAHILTAPGAGGLSEAPATQASSSNAAPYASRPTRTARSLVYSTASEEMLRARSGACGDHNSPLMEFFDARLRRDIQCPSPIRYLRYLHRLAFSPWYYTPVHVLYPSFAWDKSDVLYDAHVCPFTLEFFTSAAALEEFQWKLARGCTHRQQLSKVSAPAAASSQSTTSSGSAASSQHSNSLSQSTSSSLPSLTPVVFESPATLMPVAGALLNLGRPVRDRQSFAVRPLRPPGGVEVYRNNDTGISLFEIRGKSHPEYVRNVFLIGKAFLENKLVGHDVDVYVFYVVCLHAAKHAPYALNALGIHSDEDMSAADGMIFAGFFSWEEGVSHDNLACIAVLPCFGGMGLGNFLIAASYELAYRRGDVGSPERPLSDLGHVAYRVYWRDVIFCWLSMRLAHAIEESLGVHPTWRTDAELEGPLFEATRDHTAMVRSTRMRSKNDAGKQPTVLTAGLLKSKLWPYSRRFTTPDDVAHVVEFLRYAWDAIRSARSVSGGGAHALPRAVGDQGSSGREVKASQGRRAPKRGRSKRDSATATAAASKVEMVVIDDDDDDDDAISVSSGTSGDEGERSGDDTPAVNVRGSRPHHQRSAAASAADVEVLFNVHVRQIAAEVMLEEADVLDCLLWCGLIHRVPADETTAICAPLLYIAAVLEDRVVVPPEDSSKARVVVRFDPTRLTDRKRKQR